MRTIRRFDDFPTVPGTHQPEFMAHLESCSIVKGGIPAGTAADPLHKHPFDQFYFVLSGTVGVQLGADKIRAEPNTLVRIPTGVAHFAYNDGVDEVVQLEILLPTPVPATKGKLVPIMELCDELGDAPPPNCVRPLEASGWISPVAGRGLETQVLASRELGSEHGMIAVTRMSQATPEPGGYRIHRFDELYFVLDGVLTVDVAGERHRAERYDLVVIPAGVPYRAWNSGPGLEQHLTVVTPQPLETDPAAWSHAVSFSL